MGAFLHGGVFCDERRSAAVGLLFNTPVDVLHVPVMQFAAETVVVERVQPGSADSHDCDNEGDDSPS